MGARPTHEGLIVAAIHKALIALMDEYRDIGGPIGLHLAQDGALVSFQSNAKFQVEVQRLGVEVRSP